MNIQTAYAKALIIDREALAKAQEANDVILSNKIVMDAFNTDVEPLLGEVRLEMGLVDTDPLMNYRDSGYAKRIIEERKEGGMNTLGG